jgi:WD40 repeat protein
MVRQAERRRKRRRVAVGAIIAVLVGGLSVFGALWRKSEAETRRAEASKLLALGQLELEDYPTAAVAYALKSLELADTLEARVFALQVLQKGPLAILMNLADTGEGVAHEVDFTPDGQWMALAGFDSAQLRPRDGGPPVLLTKYPTTAFPILSAKFTPQGDRLVACKAGEIRIYSVPEGKELAIRNIEPAATWLFMGSHSFYTVSEVEGGAVVRKWPLDGGVPSVVGRMNLERAGSGRSIWKKYAVGIDPSGKWFAYAQDRKILVRSLEDWGLAPRILGEHLDRIDWPLNFDAGGDRIATRDMSKEIRIWSTEGVSKEPLRVLQGGIANGPLFDESGTRLIDFANPEGRATVKLWRLTAPPEVEPLVMLRGQAYVNGAAFDPSGRWLATANANSGVTFWPFTRDYPLVLRGHQNRVCAVAFTPDGKQLVSASFDGTVRVWSLEGNEPSRIILGSEDLVYPLIDVDPSGKKLLVSGHRGKVFLVPLEKGLPRELEGFSPESVVGPVAFRSDGRVAAAASTRGPKQEKVIRIWDLESGESSVLGPVEDAGDLTDGGYTFLYFLPDGRLLSGADGGLRIWNLEHQTMNLLKSSEVFMGALSRDGQHMLYGEVPDRTPRRYQIIWTDVRSDESRNLDKHGSDVVDAAFGPTGSLAVTCDSDGAVRVGPVTGEEPHLLFGHEGTVSAVTVSPDGRWIASAGVDKTIRLWPMPDMDQPPFHTLPYEEILTRLRNVTNLRVIEDDGSSTGYRLDIAPFPGWKTVPRW